MLHILLFILIFIFVFILIVFSLFRKALSFLFGGLFGNRNKQEYTNKGYYNNQNQNNNSSQAQSDSSKVFSSNEGEYVNYEEVE